MDNTVTNLDLFKEFFMFVKNPKHDLDLTLIEFGGSSLYIPSHKTTFRNLNIIEDLKKGLRVKALARKYDLSEAQIYAITKEFR